MVYKENGNLEKIINCGILFFLVLFFLQFLGTHKFVIWGISTLGGGIICLVYALKWKKLRVAMPEAILVLTFFFYSLISRVSIPIMILYTCLSPLFLMVGKYLSQEKVLKKNKMDCAFLLIGIFILGYTFHGVLNCVIYFCNGFALDRGRAWADIWGGILPATQHSVYTLPVLSQMFPAFLYWKKHKTICTSIICTGIFFLFHAFHSSSRIQIMVWGLLLIWEFLLYVLLNRKNKKAMQMVKRCMIAVAGVSIVLALVLIMKRDVLQNWSMINALARDGGILHNVRFQAQLRVLQQLFIYPMGNTEMDLGGLYYAHNVWLDMAKATGVIPFFLLVAYTLIFMIDMAKILINTSVKPELKYVLSGLSIALLLYYMVEPALDANIAYLIPWFYLHGIMIGCQENAQV